MKALPKPGHCLPNNLQAVEIAFSGQNIASAS
jgi:hypothetical protein